jgi:uncharacterized protein (TIRG00374 family)
METLHKSHWRQILTLITFTGLVILIYALRDQITQVLHDLGKVNTWALLLMIPLQIINYDAYARLYRSLFGTMGKKVSYWGMYKLTLELNFVNHVLPSGGVSGISYFSVRAKSEGISTAQATLAQVQKMFLLYVSYQPLLIVGLFLLAIRGHVNDLIIVVATTLITLTVIGTLFVIYVIGSRERINSFLTFFTRVINSFVGFFWRRKPEVIKVERAQKVFIELHDNYKLFQNNMGALRKPFMYTMIANITEVASVYVVYLAFGELVNVGAVILAYAVANFAGLLSVLPAGIGIYEGLMTAVLAATGIPAKLSIPVTLMYRVLNMFIQLTPGYYFYQRAVKNGLTNKT